MEKFIARSCEPILKDCLRNRFRAMLVIICGEILNEMNDFLLINYGVTIR